MFEEMKSNPRTTPNIITYNSILEAAFRCHQIDLAERLFAEMKQTVQPD